MIHGPEAGGAGHGFPAKEEAMKLISALAADGELLSKLTGSYWEYIKTRVCLQTHSLKTLRKRLLAHISASRFCSKRQPLRQQAPAGE